MYLKYTTGDGRQYAAGDGSVLVFNRFGMILDRTETDVIRWRSLRNKGWGTMGEEERQEWLSPMKGSYNYTDLNRVESAVEYVAEQLRYHGYYVLPVVKKDWTMHDSPTIYDMNRYFSNVAELRSKIKVYDTTPEAPTTAKKLDYTMANALEQILVDISELLKKLSEVWFYSGDLYCGEV